MGSAIITQDAGNIMDDGFFNESVTHTYPGGSETLNVFWDAPPSLASDRDAYDSALPAITLKTADTGNIDRRDSTITRNAVIYVIASVEEEQSGLTTIRLTEQ